MNVVATLDDITAHRPSRLPGWTRGHVLSHLARHADGLVNLLIWARTDIEHPMYASGADRDADIEEGSQRILQLLQEDLAASNDRLFVAAATLPELGWETPVTGRQGQTFPASQIPWIRLTELLIHLVDLDCEFDFDDVVTLADDQLVTLIDDIVSTYETREDVPGLRLEVTLPTHGRHTWYLGNGEPDVMRGPASAVLRWLTGRGASTELVGVVPELSGWL